MIILLVVKPKRHRPPDPPTQNESPVPIKNDAVVEPLQAVEPGGSPLEGLGAEEDGAPFRLSI